MDSSKIINDIRPPPMSIGLIGWLRQNLFNGFFNSLLTVASFYVLWKVVTPIFHWLILDSHWRGTAEQCHELDGACWSFVVHNYRFILFGFYPYEHHWRPAVAMLILVGMLWFSRDRRRWKTSLFYSWMVVFVGIAILMKGGLFGLEQIDTDMWGGLPLTLTLAVVGILFAYPLGIVLALGRTSKMPAIKVICVCYIELIRGVPLISILFMASVMFPLFLPEGVTVDKLLRAQAAIILFAAAYLAEVIRGGLQAIPKGQYEAAEALGLNTVQNLRLIILPQALKTVIPPTVSIFISTFKDTSLVVIIALFDLLHTTKSALTNAEWLGFSTEGYIFVAMIYFIFCFSMARYSIRLESELNPEKDR